MVQAAPNESRLTGVVRSQHPDPERPGFVVLDLSVGACDPGSGVQLPALAPGQQVAVVARESLVEALPLGVDLPVTAAVRMAGPGLFVVQDLAVDPHAGPIISAPRATRGADPAPAVPAPPAADPPPADPPPADPAAGNLRQALRAALTLALKNKDRIAVSAIRTALAAIDNAEAVPVGAGAGPSSEAPAGSLGVGAADVPRRELSASEIQTIVAAEIAERRHAADEIAETHPDRAATLRAEADVLATIARSS